jgi:hypothetical protein
MLEMSGFDDMLNGLQFHSQATVGSSAFGLPLQSAPGLRSHGADISHASASPDHLRRNFTKL